MQLDGGSSLRRRVLARPAWSLIGASLLAAAMSLGPGAPGAWATVAFSGTPGTAAPPAQLGPWTMTSAAPDARPTGLDVTTAPIPTGALTFDRSLRHARIGAR